MTVTDTEQPEAPPDEVAPPEPEPAQEVVAFDRHMIPGTETPIIPGWKEMQGLAAMAVTLAGAEAAPSALRRRPNDVFLVLVTARDLGVGLTTAMREFHVIDGKVTLSPKVKLAMVNERGRSQGWAIWADEANDEHRATWHATRDDRPGTTFSSTFTWAEATAAGMVREDCQPFDHSADCKKAAATKGNYSACKLNYRTYPKRMLSWRAVGYLLDDVFPEVGTGLYSPDELGAVTDDEGVPVIDVASTDPLPGTSAPRGHHGSTPPPPNPNDEPITAEERAELQARIDALGKIEPANEHGVTARAALVQLWMHQAEGTEPLPVIHSLLRRHLAKAKAMVFSIEGRAKKGEWGPWPPEPPDKATSGPPAPEAVPDAPTEPDAVPDAPAPPEAVPDALPEGADAADLVAKAEKLAEKAAGAAPPVPDPEPPAPPVAEPQSLMEAMEERTKPEPRG